METLDGMHHALKELGNYNKNKQKYNYQPYQWDLKQSYFSVQRKNIDVFTQKRNLCQVAAMH